VIASLLGPPGFDEDWIQDFEAFFGIPALDAFFGIEAAENDLGIESVEDGFGIAFDGAGDGDLFGFAQKLFVGIGYVGRLALVESVQIA
jgi:hypothetical protein